MSERKRPDGRAVWSTPRRMVWRVGCALFNFFVGPFLKKHEDGTITASWTALFAGALLVALIMRIAPAQNADGSWVFPAVGWPEVFLIFVTLYVKPVNDALNALNEVKPGRLAELLIGKMGVGEVAQQKNDFVPHQWVSGDPDEGII